MSDIKLACKGYVDSKVCKEYTDTKTGDVENKMPNGMFASYYAHVYYKPGEILEITHLCFPVFTPTKDNVYLGVADSNFTSGTPYAVTEETLTAGTHRYIWFKLIRPMVFDNSLTTAQWINYNTYDILTYKYKSTDTYLHMLEKTSIDGEDVYTSVGKITYSGKIDQNNIFMPLQPTNVQFSTTGEELEYGGYKCGRIAPYMSIYPTLEALLGIRYKIYKTDGKNPEALTTTAYVNSKAGITGGDNSLASKEYVDSLV